MNIEMMNLKNKLNFILNFVEDKTNILYVDYPLYYNVGDLLIMEGTLQFFKENNIDIKKSVNARSYDIGKIKRLIDRNTTIICQGGGNFGDIYELHQKIRNDLIESFPENRIIILPQTAYFENNVNLINVRNIIKKHGNVVLFARDERTLDIFKSFSEHSYLLPDMAHALYGSLKKNDFIKDDVLYFLRNDIEQNPVQISFNQKKSIDWDDLISNNDRLFLKFLEKSSSLNRKILKIDFFDDFLFNLWRRKAGSLVQKSSKIFSSYNLVITSRMHGHILSCLVDTPSKIIDNSYGKNTSYFYAWTKKVGNSSVIDGDI